MFILTPTFSLSLSRDLWTPKNNWGFSGMDNGWMDEYFHLTDDDHLFYHVFLKINKDIKQGILAEDLFTAAKQRFHQHLCSGNRSLMGCCFSLQYWTGVEFISGVRALLVASSYQCSHSGKFLFFGFSWCLCHCGSLVQWYTSVFKLHVQLPTELAL